MEIAPEIREDDLAQVEEMVLVCIVPGAHFGMTGLAGWRLSACIAVQFLDLLHAFFGSMAFRAGCIRVMHLCTGMAGHTIHALQPEMRVAGNLFMLAQIFIPHAASVTGCAILRHRGCL